MAQNVDEIEKKPTSGIKRADNVSRVLQMRHLSVPVDGCARVPRVFHAGFDLASKSDATLFQQFEAQDSRRVKGALRLESRTAPDGLA